MTTPAMMASGPLTPPHTESAPTTIKLEDLHVPYTTPSPSPSTMYTEPSSQTPAPSTTESKPVKKRKSWGQVLPEPKTSLPPRKRAKTEDEKEQRRIERVKRNRLAAHNSRERKRQETEHLQQQKDALENEMAQLRAKAARVDKLEAELSYWHQKYPGEKADTSELSFSFTEANTMNPSQALTAPPFSPISMDSMDSPRDSSCQPETPASTFEAAPEFDLTQYPAAMLCDLQFDSKPPVLEDLFDFDQFSGNTLSVEPTVSLSHNDDFFGTAFFGSGSISDYSGFPDGFDAKFSDMQSASGAPFGCDEALAADN
ncbi:transcription factor that binds to CRE motif [Curvularia kusanoi]|uniref:Transcription factor that binds to CRE motif n=1 Tax=Curvularia kusanoi TaxID=90978 RepID=A0A9P4W994_CURKU|nr:transcription factor that binds to CRE motif [Curvularia kusanoi]